MIAPSRKFRVMIAFGKLLDAGVVEKKIFGRLPFSFPRLREAGKENV